MLPPRFGCGCDSDRLKGLLDDRLSPHEEAELDVHLGNCTDCRKALESLAADRAWWVDLRRLGGRDGVGNGAGESASGGAAAEDAPLGLLEPSDSPGSLGRLGPYEVAGVLGRGGMGVVLRGFDPRLNRPVAIKIIAPELATSAAARRRFAREARAAAAVTHDHVVAIHDVAESSTGLPYLVMPFISGRSLQERLDGQGPLGVKEVLRIGMQTASGLAAAHAQGLVHRDVKPANILLENGVERVKITDFGLARAADDVSPSQSGVVAGTPQYMSPEQANGLAIDARSDLFSMGSVLYAMLTGHAPFRGETNMAVLRRVCEDQPRPIREINPEVPDWLAAIIAKLHAKDPADRFGSAAEVADVLGRCLVYLERPEGSAPPFPASRIPGRAPRRLRWGPAVALAVALVAFGAAEATGLSPVMHLLTTVLRIKTPEGTLVIDVDDPEVKILIDDQDVVITGAGPQEIRLNVGTHRLLATKGSKTVNENVVTIMRDQKQIVVIRHELDETGDRIGERSARGENRQDRTAKAAGVPVAPGTRIVVPENYRPGPPRQAPLQSKTVAAGPTIPGARPEDLLQPVPLSDRSPAPLWPRPAITFMAYSPDGKLLAMASNGEQRGEGNLSDRKILLFELPARRLRGTLRGHSARVMELAFSPDGTRLAAATGHYGFSAKSGEVWLWDVTKPEEPGIAAVSGIPMLFTVAFSPDGRTLAYAGWDDVVSLHDLASGKVRAVCRGHKARVRSVAFSPDGKLLASGASDRTVRLWDPETGKPLGPPFPPLRPQIFTVAFSPDGQLLAAHTSNWIEHPEELAGAPQIKVWDVATRRERASLKGHPNHVLHMAFAPDGKTLATAGGIDDGPGEVILWDVATWTPRATLSVFPTAVECVAYSRDSKTLMAATTHKGVQSEIRVWDLAPPPFPVREFRVGNDGGHYKLWSIALAPGGKSLAAGTGKFDTHGVLWLWDLATGRGTATHRTRLGIFAIAYAPDGKRLALGTFDGALVVCDADGRERTALPGHAQSINAVAFSPDGKRIASASQDGTTKLWDVAAGQEMGSLRLNGQEVWSLAFSPDGDTLAAGLKNGAVSLLNFATGAETKRLEGHALGVGGLAYSPDGARIVSGSWDKTVRIWNPTTRESVAILEGHEDPVKSVAFSSDGRWVASGDGVLDGSNVAGVLMVWDVAARSLRAKLRGHHGRIWSVAFSPEGQRVASGGEDGFVELWDLTGPEPGRP